MKYRPNSMGCGGCAQSVPGVPCVGMVCSIVRPGRSIRQGGVASQNLVRRSYLVYTGSFSGTHSTSAKPPAGGGPLDAHHRPIWQTHRDANTQHEGCLFASTCVQKPIG